MRGRRPDNRNLAMFGNEGSVCFVNDPSLNVLILGDSRPDEFQPALELVRRHVEALSLRTAADLPAFRQITDGWFPDFVVVLQAWPDQYSADEVYSLFSCFPLARCVCCFGPWCDSDGRTRSIWPLAVRVPAAAFASRFQKELRLMANGRDARPPLPWTASRTESFEFDFDLPPAHDPSARGVSLISPDRRFCNMLAAAVEAAGFHVLESHITDQPAAIVFDADPWDSDRATALAIVRSAHRRSQLVACVGFQRPHVDAELRRGGVDGVWFKLAPLSELVEYLAAERAPGALE
jgi:hypothetical protein